MANSIREMIVDWVMNYKDIAERHALAETPAESANYLLSILQSYIAKQGLTDGELNKIQKFPFIADLTLKRCVSQATITKILEGLKEK